MEEIFKIYKTTSDRWGKRVRVYEVSNLGRIKINGEIIERSKLSNGYVYLTNGTLLHRVVAELFVPNPDNKPEIDHINCIKTDNRAENLRWVTRSENMLNPITSENHSKTFKGKLAGEKHPMYGRPNPNPYKGTHWMNNGIDQMRVFPPWDKDMLIFGWQYGKLKRSH